AFSSGPGGALPATLRAGRPQEIRAQRADGASLRLEVSITEVNLKEGTFHLAWFRELGDAAAAQQPAAVELLKRSEAQFRAAVEALGEGLVITDARDHVLHANTRLAQLLGLRQEEMVGKPVADVLVPDEDPGAGGPPRIQVA